MSFPDTNHDNISPSPMSQFKTKIHQIIQLIPEGKVASYGQVALYAGIPRAARQVGWILHQSGHLDNLPWWRVVNNAGRISIKGNLYCTPEMQKKLLESEGIKVNADLTLDIEKYRFLPDQKFLKNLAGRRLHRNPPQKTLSVW